jgi:hypothetical protein
VRYLPWTCETWSILGLFYNLWLFTWLSFSLRWLLYLLLQLFLFIDSSSIRTCHDITASQIEWILRNLVHIHIDFFFLFLWLALKVVSKLIRCLYVSHISTNLSNIYHSVVFTLLVTHSFLLTLYFWLLHLFLVSHLWIIQSIWLN